jgi:CcmD family protein
MNHNYVAMAVVLVIWAALFFYLIRVERKADKLNREKP